MLTRILYKALNPYENGVPLIIQHADPSSINWTLEQGTRGFRKRQKRYPERN